MNRSARGNTPFQNEIINPPIFAVVLGFFAVACLFVVALLAVASGAVWLTMFVGAWLDLPAISVLVAFVGLLLVVSVFVTQTRITAALREQSDASGLLSGLMEHVGFDEDDEDDEDSEFVSGGVA